MEVLNPTTRFSDRVADYVKARPRYPDSLVDLLHKAIGLTHDHVIADIGSGTGLSAEPFLRHGHTVICVEPNPEMRAAAEELLQAHPGFRSVAGSAAETGLADHSVDCILVAQAFHWFDAGETKKEFTRILRDDGWVCLVWNVRKTVDTRFLERYEALLHEFGTDYEQVRHRTDRVAGGQELEAFFTRGYERRVLENWQDLDLDGLKSRLRSSSYAPPPAAPQYAPMMEALAQLYADEAHDGKVRIPYDLEVFYGRI